MNHDWRTPRLHLSSGVQLYWCARCGKFSPVMREGKCESTAFARDPKTNEPMYAIDITRRLMDCIMESKSRRTPKPEEPEPEVQKE